MPLSAGSHSGVATTGLRRTSLAIPSATAFTIMSWFRWDGGSTTQTSFLSLGSSVIEYDTEISGTTTFDLWNGATATGVTGSSIVAGRWYHNAMTGDASNLSSYLDGVLDAQTAIGSLTPTIITVLGGIPAVSAHFNGNATAVKIWNRALSADEIKQEMNFVLPVNRAGLNSCYPMADERDWMSAGVPPFGAASDPLADWSGNGLRWTQTGDIRMEAGPNL